MVLGIAQNLAGPKWVRFELAGEVRAGVLPRFCLPPLTSCSVLTVILAAPSVRTMVSAPRLSVNALIILTHVASRRNHPYLMRMKLTASRPSRHCAEGAADGNVDVLHSTPHIGIVVPLTE